MSKDADSEVDSLTWRTEQRRIGDLIEWEKNPRKLSEKSAASLQQSLLRFGYVEEIVVNADGRSIIGGHMRRKIALAHAILRPDDVVDVRVPSRELTPKESEELAIRLNKNTGEWDWDLLANEFDEDELQLWGFDSKEFGKLPDVGEDQTSDVKSGHDIIVSVASEGEQKTLLEEFIRRGLKCRAVVY